MQRSTPVKTVQLRSHRLNTACHHTSPPKPPGHTLFPRAPTPDSQRHRGAGCPRTVSASPQSTCSRAQQSSTPHGPVAFTPLGGGFSSFSRGLARSRPGGRVVFCGPSPNWSARSQGVRAFAAPTCGAVRITARLAQCAFTSSCMRA